VYARGLIEAGARKSLEPMVARLGGEADYEALQHFLADSPWEAAVIERAVAERVCPVIDPQAWVLDDTGVVKDGKHSPGVKRQYSGTLGKTGNCQVTVSLHALGAGGTVPLGFKLYLPEEEWCVDVERRQKAKIPDSVEFATKPALGGELAVRAAGWEIGRAPVLGDQAYGDDSKLRARLDEQQLEYVLSVSPTTTVFDAGTRFEIPPAKPGAGRPPSVPKPDREHTQVRSQAAYRSAAGRNGSGQRSMRRWRRPWASRPRSSLASTMPRSTRNASTSRAVSPGLRPERPPSETAAISAAGRSMPALRARSRRRRCRTLTAGAERSSSHPPNAPNHSGQRSARRSWAPWTQTPTISGSR
jgi:SRSO17 transposase